MISAKAVSYTEGYRSGHNEAVLKTVWGSNPTWVRIPHPPPQALEKPSVFKGFLFFLLFTHARFSKKF